MEKVIVVIGPTSVGKTKMGVALAKKFNGEVISGDSMQIYKQMDIGTAKVTEEEKEGIIHHCVDILNPDETYSVHDFQQTVRKKITEITQRGHVPIIVGGTGLYIKANNEKEDLLLQIDEQRFAMIEMNLYLDLYPNNKEALNRFNTYLKKEKELVTLYESKYGPLTTSSPVQTNNWTWNNSPWPWEVQS